jgi:hypothetical protein
VCSCLEIHNGCANGWLLVRQSSTDVLTADNLRIRLSHLPAQALTYFAKEAT